MSSGRSRSAGTAIGTTESRKNRSSRKRSRAISSSRFLLVAAITRTSTSIVFCEPIRSTSPSCSTRSTFACVRRLMSPTSSRKIVPRCASSNLPICFSVAPVNEPFSWPNSSLSISSSGIAAQLTWTKASSARSELRWIARATSSLPTPLSPRDQHRGARGRGAPHRVPDLLERRALAHHAVAVVEDEPQPAVLLDEPLLAEGVARRDQDPLAVGRLLDEVEGAELDGLDRGLDGAVAGQDHDRQRGRPSP